MKHFFIALVEHYGNLGITAGLFLEFLGLPVPGEALMAFLGYMVWENPGSSLAVSIVCAAAGTFVGSMLAYSIGYRYGEDFFIRYGRYILITKEKLQQTEGLVMRNKVLLLLFSRYVPGVRHIVPYLGGISKINLTTFLIYNLIGSVIWCASLVGLGFALGENWNRIETIVKGYFYIIILVIVFIIIVTRYFGKYRKLIFTVTIPVLLFIKLCEDLIRNELSVFDQSIYGYLSGFISGSGTDVMIAISYIGSVVTLLPLTLLIFIILKGKRRDMLYGKVIALNLGITWIFNEAFKFAFHRQRPDIMRLVEVGGYSFPSGHSMVSMSFYGLLLYFAYSQAPNRITKYIAAVFFSLLILFIGISRIYLGVHYASDVLAGFSAGFAWLIIYIALVKRYYKYRIKKGGTAMLQGR